VPDELLQDDGVILNSQLVLLFKFVMAERTSVYRFIEPLGQHFPSAISSENEAANQLHILNWASTATAWAHK